MSRDQRPGTVRIVSDPRATLPRNRRHDDAQSAGKSGRNAAPSPGESTTPDRRRWVVPASLFAAGFALGGLLVAARNLLQVPGL
ncbi:hypothetical protein [Sphingobium boeckii]|uniref:Uncharacterized protein n=1 Tax=Sphingobium boeckii TaxID=1082345 RepID=A0A7W9AGI1_9SPHN|nr:hypothetical protein [Sphingobium boeckii]MBB5685255.1 hypothetical protein [Sphingobium boeckii]